jgi:hypothetical protein
MTLVSEANRRPTISFGVPAGATMLCQMPRSKPGRVSAICGISGENLDLAGAPLRHRHVGALEAERNVAGEQSGD